MMKSKIHRVKVTESNLQYQGSITIDEELMEKADILEYEQVDVYNVTNGERFTTYAIKGERGSGVVCLNGAAAHKGKKGDVLIIVTYGMFSEAELKEHRPLKICVDESNRILPDTLSPM